MKSLEEYFRGAKYISPKRVKNYAWQARDGSIYYQATGKRIYTDYISALWDKLLLHRKVGHSQLVSYREKIDGFIYFHIGDKFYKTDALMD